MVLALSSTLWKEYYKHQRCELYRVWSERSGLKCKCLYYRPPIEVFGTIVIWLEISVDFSDTWILLQSKDFGEWFYVKHCRWHSFSSANESRHRGGLNAVSSGLENLVSALSARTKEMARKNATNSPSLPIDSYRKQIGESSCDIIRLATVDGRNFWWLKLPQFTAIVFLPVSWFRCLLDFLCSFDWSHSAN